MRIIIKRLLGCAVILALAAVMLAKAADITELKLCRNKFHNFFEHAEDFDVLFIGSSHMVNGSSRSNCGTITGSLHLTWAVTPTTSRRPTGSCFPRESHT